MSNSNHQFRESVSAILEKHDIEMADEEYHRTCITEDGFARIYASDLVIVIQPLEEVMHISTLEPAKTFTHDFPKWDDISAIDIPDFWSCVDYSWWLDNLKPALFEIFDILESPDISSEKKTTDEIDSIIEADKGIVKHCLKGNALFLVKNNAGLNGQVYEFALSPEAVNYRIDNGPWKHSSALQYISSHPSEEWSNTVLQLVCELEKRTPEDEKVIQLRKQVEDLQGRLSEYEKPLEEQAQEWVERREFLEAEKAKCNQEIEDANNRHRQLDIEVSIIQKQIDVFSYRIKKLNQKGVTSDS